MRWGCSRQAAAACRERGLARAGAHAAFSGTGSLGTCGGLPYQRNRPEQVEPHNVFHFQRSVRPSDEEGLISLIAERAVYYFFYY